MIRGSYSRQRGFKIPRGNNEPLCMTGIVTEPVKKTPPKTIPKTRRRSNSSSIDLYTDALTKLTTLMESYDDKVSTLLVVNLILAIGVVFNIFWITFLFA